MPIGMVCPPRRSGEYVTATATPGYEQQWSGWSERKRGAGSHGSFSVLAGPAWEDHGMPSRRVAVGLEVAPKQAVASALDWPGWCRAGRDEQAALEALADYARRYAPVAAHAGVGFPATVAFDVVERVPG